MVSLLNASANRTVTRGGRTSAALQVYKPPHDVLQHNAEGVSIKSADASLRLPDLLFPRTWTPSKMAACAGVLDG